MYLKLKQTMLVSTLLAGLFTPTVTLAATSLGADYTPLDPVGWSVGDADSTSQTWDTKDVGANPDTTPDSYNVGGATLTAPAHGVDSPGFMASSGNWYAYAGDYDAYATVYTQGGSSGSGSFDSTYGTHVIVQIGSSINEASVVADSLNITDLSGNVLTGGSMAEALASAQVYYNASVPSSFGAVEYQALAFEFWLPEYTDDFEVTWTQMVHTSLDIVRVDSKIALAAEGESPFETSVPEPASLALLAAGLCFAASPRRRRVEG